MPNIRVYKLAKEIDLPSHDLVEMLQELGIDVSSHMCSITEADAQTVIDLLEKGSSVVVDEIIENISEMDEDIIEVKELMPLGEFANLIGKQANALIMDLMGMSVMATINQNIDFDTMTKLANKYSIIIKQEEVQIDALYNVENFEDKDEDLEFRSPIVTVMGHVDHGKTSLLDAIRKTDVTDGEAGGITQHIGASEVTINEKRIVFLDTPGHESFTSLRARGTQVTDIAILVVAADDGVMPQTIEAIDHAKAAGVPIIVAINKMDVDGANPDRVMKELSEHGILVEDWGGDTIAVKVAAIKNEGIDELLEMVLLVAEIEDLKANPNRAGIGTIIEANLDKGRGPVATVIVATGTMKVGDDVTVGRTFGKIRAMYDYHGKKVKKVGPSTPVEITGLSEVPVAGDKLYVTSSSQRARELAEFNKIKFREEKINLSKHVSLEDLFSQIKEGDLKKLNLIIKADAHGSIEALRGSLLKIKSDEIKINIIHANIGAVTEADVSLASASNAIVIGFNVRPSTATMLMAKKEAVELRTYRIIYNAIDDVKNAMIGLLEPEFEEVIQGQVEIRDLFTVSKIGTIAGCYVTEGFVTRNSEVRLLRNNVIVYEGELSSLKRFQDDAKEVKAGYECGLTLDKYNDLKVGDILEAFTIKEVKRKEL